MTNLSARIEYNGRHYMADLTKPIDISIPIGRNDGPNAFYLGEAQYKTVEAGSFTGDVRRGGSCNVEDIIFSPHGNGTHTECSGHISGERFYINDALKQFLFVGSLITIEPQEGIISKQAIEEALHGAPHTDALIIRTLPNSEEKKTAKYSGTSPAYMQAEAAKFIKSQGIQHLLIDLPSLDKEDDQMLTAHHMFFKEGEALDRNKTVTEMIYVDNSVADGLYLLNIQIASFESDASPSKPVLYALKAV